MRTGLIAAATALLLGACAAVDIDRGADDFDAVAYDKDLSACRGGPAAMFMVSGMETAVIGSIYGLVNGARIGADAGNTDKGAIIGVIVGSILGFTAGAYHSIEEHDAALARCLRDKGYGPGVV